MNRRVALTALLICCIAPVSRAQEPEPATAARNRASVTLLQLNDVYSAVPTDGLGGLARVATEKQQLAASGHRPFMMIAGDFLAPSMSSSVFKGEQMIAALNAAGVDLATLGNHEFDFGDDVLIERMKEATFGWVVSNVVDTRTGRPIGNAAPYLMKTFGTLKVGFIGLCLNTSEVANDKLSHSRIDDPIAAAAKYVPLLKRQGAQVVVALTHLNYTTDVQMVEKVPQIDLVVGGHEHYLITSTVGRALISKSGSDARYVARIDVNRRPNGAVERFYELIPTSASFADDPKTAEVIAAYDARLGKELDVVVAVSKVPLEGRSAQLRTMETNLGDLMADAIRAEAGTDVALTNSGSIRGSRILPAGPIARRTLHEIHPFDNVICEVEMTGRTLLAMLNNGVARLPVPAGQFPQISGMRMMVDSKGAVGDRVHDVTVGGVPLDPAKIYTVAMPDFVFKGGDGYRMVSGQRVLVGPLDGQPITGAFEKYVSDLREVTPVVDGRITIR